MASSADNYQNRLQQEIEDRAEASGHSAGGPGLNQERLANETTGSQREPSYIDRNSTGDYPREKSGLDNGFSQGQDQRYSSNSNGILSNNNNTDGEREYPGRENAQVVDHETFTRLVGHDDSQRQGQEYVQTEPTSHQAGQPIQPGQVYPYEQQGIQQQQPYLDEQQQQQDNSSRPDMQPSRSYLGNRPASTYTQQQQQPQLQTYQENEPTNNTGFAGVGSGIPQHEQPSNDYSNQHIQSLQHGAALSSFPASGAGILNHRQSQQYQPQQQQQQYQQPQQEYRESQQLQQPVFHQVENTRPQSIAQPQQQQQPLQNLNTSDLERKNTGGTAHTRLTSPTTGAIAVGNGLGNNNNYTNGEPVQVQQQQQRQQALSPTPTSPTAAQNMNGIPDIRALSSGTSAAAAPIAGGGLGAALASSGHDLKSGDKKALKNEIKTEQKFAKSLGSQAKSEGKQIEDAIKMAKLSSKAAEKSGKHELGFRKTYDRAVKDEVKMKERLLKITTEYNKVAAELEKATKEMEIRKNSHNADLETRDADARKVDELRKAKGVHDMEREALHGESLTKQAQAKRALSMSSRRKSSVL